MTRRFRTCWPLMQPAVGSLASGRRTSVHTKSAFAFNAETDDPFRPDAEDWRVETAANGFATSRQYLRLTTDFDHARLPGVDGGEIVDHDCHARVLLNVAVLLALRKVVAADVDGVRFRVVA